MPKNANSNGLAAKLQVKAVPGTLYSVIGFNTGGQQYVSIYDTAGTPTSQKPRMTVLASANDSFFFDFITPKTFDNGIFVGNSTAADAYVAGASDCLFDATYV